MEKQLFDVAGGWDISDTMVFAFYDVTSKIAIGKFPAGTKFSSVWFDYENGELTLYQGLDEDETEVGKFDLLLVVK